jgi:uncharacterized cupredoxin-like copper-binding protein
MNPNKQPHHSSLDKSDESVRIIEHRSSSKAAMMYKLLALAVVAGSIAFCISQFKISSANSAVANQQSMHEANASSAIAAQETNGGTVSAEPLSTAERIRAARLLEVQNDRNDLSHYVAAGQAPSMKEVITRLHEAGIYTGLGAFNPPGTNPPMVGLAVPENYELPEGYVRHYQATDDGQPIEAILMYSPDYDFYDGAGQRIDLPANRVVPTHLAPPGLPIRMITIPAPLQTPGP